MLPLGQASIPACAMGLVIRLVGTDGAACRTGSGFALALEVCIALIEVEQRARWASRERENARSGNQALQSVAFLVAVWPEG